MTNSKNSRQREDYTRSNKGEGSDKNSHSSGKSSQSGNKESHSDKEDRPDPDEEPVTESGSDIDPDRNIQIDDDPEQTKRKIPQMRK